ncbi:uncharacterized protein BXZ73DRAFT_55464 [Epithele typhae]|uniref:uncharacterized protein n=1 Tax=Epithele typhae TaxID=378194 RepID=UPI002008D72F|nr:uncharacterized protein BXZ73DRAFT_55464 [Epithele typhae]KAH9913552.1 hypothetical protein BXZ73DRAFT_55464 [Epithele typhae]
MPQEADTSFSSRTEVASISRSWLLNVEQETKETVSHTCDAVLSLAWLWPVRGIIFCVTNPHIILSVRSALLKSLISSLFIFAVLAFFAFLPQMAFLAIFTGPLAPLFALFLVGAESLALITLFSRALFLEPALTHVFDTTLAARGQRELVRAGTARVTKRASAQTRIGAALVRPLQAFSPGGLVRYVLTLPLNAVPVVGTAFFLLYNGHKAGPGWHARYFALKGLSEGQRAAFVERRRAEYTAFGMMTLVFNFVPLVGLLFSFTNAMGAALWAAELEAQENILEGDVAAGKGKKKKE